MIASEQSKIAALGRPELAAAVCIAFFCALGFSVYWCAEQVLDARQDISDGRAILAQLRERSLAEDGSGPSASGRGSPFIAGQTRTVAGATLLQRVAEAARKVGGTVLSSQVDVQGPEAKQGFVSLIVSCDLTQNALQSFLYDLEAGMPYLFVDQLDVQPPTSASPNYQRVRVLVGVSGQWDSR